MACTDMTQKSLKVPITSKLSLVPLSAIGNNYVDEAMPTLCVIRRQHF